MTGIALFELKIAAYNGLESENVAVKV